MKKIIDTLDIEKIIALKNNGLTMQEIADLLDTSKTTICRILNDNGMRSMKYVHARSGSTIAKKYRSGNTIDELSEEYKAHCKTIISLLRQNGEKIDEYNRYSVNSSYFHILDDQNKAYILGLIYSDGSITDNELIIALQECDMHILDSIRVLLGSTNPLKYINQKSKSETYQNQYKLLICNKQIVDDLKKYGVEKNKSLKSKYPNFISDELFPHFLRGVFDGDGHIDKKNYTISITGTKDLLFGIKKELDKKFNLAICIFPVKNSEIIYEFKITNMNDCITFLDYIYTDAILFIRRKYDVYQKYLNEPLQK